jgi:hypothetical protein
MRLAAPVVLDLRTVLLPRPSDATNAGDPKVRWQYQYRAGGRLVRQPDPGPDPAPAAGFQRAAIGQWREPDGTQVSDIVFLFGDHPSATTFTYAAQNSYSLNRLFVAPVAIPGIPVGNVYQLSAAGPDKQFLTEVFLAKNNMTVELSIIGRPSCPRSGPCRSPRPSSPSSTGGFSPVSGVAITVRSRPLTHRE